ncbi:MAG: tetratricopeptide repeat protein, partial [Magnetospirillum sp.]|nr:tetratricopeptide repeat protein [Magnetospirillum sp.]
MKTMAATAMLIALFIPHAASAEEDRQQTRIQLQDITDRQRRSGDNAGLCRSLGGVAQTDYLLGRQDEAIAAASEAVSVCGSVKDRSGQAMAWNLMGNSWCLLGRLAEARQAYDDALPLYKAVQDRLGQANTLMSLGNLERRLGRLAEARQAYDDALPLFKAEQDRQGQAN